MLPIDGLYLYIIAALHVYVRCGNGVNAALEGLQELLQLIYIVR